VSIALGGLGSVGISDDGLEQFPILAGASGSFTRVLWNGR